MNPLAKYLKQHGLTVGAFARMSGLHRATLWHIAHGSRGAGVDMIVAIEKATGGAVKVDSWLKHRRAA